MKFLLSSLSSIKPYLRWIMIGGIVFFLLKYFKDHGQEVAEIQMTSRGWYYLALALVITTLAHILSSLVWIFILRTLKQPIEWGWGAKIYLKTNMAKYLPGNVWHLYGRILALKERGISLSIASLSVILETLLMAAGAFIIGIVGFATGNVSFGALPLPGGLRVLLFLILGGVLIGIHPLILNPLLRIIKRLKVKDNPVIKLQINQYPWLPLISSSCFVVLRAVGFLLTLAALGSFNFTQTPLIVSVFSLAWLLGFITPGAPGGIGIFETTILIFLDKILISGVLLTALALYRVISLTAEVLGAGLTFISVKPTTINKP